MLQRGPAGPRRGQGPVGGATARRRRPDRSRAARARRRVPHVPRRGDRPADRGRLPELRAADPERLPEPVDVPREPFVEALDRVQIVGQNRDNAAVRLAMSPRRSRAVDVGPGRRQRAGVARREVRRHRARRSRSTRRSCATASTRSTRPRSRSRPSTRSSRRRCARPTAATSCTCSCRCAHPESTRAGAATRSSRGRAVVAAPTSGASRTSISSSRPGSPCCAATTGRARRACSKRSAGSRGRGRSAASPTRCWCARAPSRRSCAPRSSPATRTQLFEAEIRVAGRNRILCNKQNVARAATCTACCASACSHPTTSRS